MRIGLFSDTYLPAVNGISYVVESTRQELEKHGHSVYVFAPAPSFRYKESDPNIIRYRAIKGISFKDNLTSVFFPPQQVRKIRRMGLDVIHFFSPNQIGLLGIYVAVSEDIPLVGQYCTDIFQYTAYYPNASTALAWLPAAIPVASQYPPKYWRDVAAKLRQKKASEEWRQRVISQVMRVVHDQCQFVIAPSPKMALQLKSFGISAPIKLIPNGSDPLPLSPALRTRFANKYKIDSNDKVILYVGRLAVEKNLELLIAAFEHVAAKITDAKLILCGDFDYREELEVLAARSRFADRIIFTGMIKHQQLGALYSLADVFAFPSLTDTQGLVLHEAANAGLPIVMTDTSISRVVKDGVNGFFADNNSRDFAGKLIAILNKPELRASMSSQSRKLASHYSVSTQINKLEAIYSQLVSRPN